MCCNGIFGGARNLAQSPAVGALKSIRSIKIKEKASLFEAASAAALIGQDVGTVNKYRVLDGSSGNELFYAVETSSCLQRHLRLCCGDCASWHVEIVSTENGLSQEAFLLERPWTWTCCCFNRPRVQVKLAKTSTLIGSIVDPCTCCALMRFSVKDADGNDVAVAEPGCCQWGLCCPCPCGPCSRIQLTIKDAHGKQAGSVNRQIPGPCSFCFAPQVDHYNLDFGSITDPTHKVLLMSMAIFMDFRYFNDNSWDN